MAASWLRTRCLGAASSAAGLASLPWTRIEAILSVLLLLLFVVPVAFGPCLLQDGFVSQEVPRTHSANYRLIDPALW